MAANIFRAKEDHPSKESCSPIDESLISPPENASLKFLMPSRRHYPHVEPVLATYKKFHVKWWLNHFLSLQETSFIAKNVISWSLMMISYSRISIHCCFPLELINSAIFMKKNCCKNPHFSLILLLFSFIINLHLDLFFPMKFLHFSCFPSFPSYNPFYKV